MVRTFPPPAGPSVAPSPQGPATALLPLLRPPPAAAPPPPARPPLPAWASPPPGWARTLHAAPAAWPKQSPVCAAGGFSRGSAPFGPQPPEAAGAAEAARAETVQARRARQEREARACVAGNLEAEATSWTPAELAQLAELADSAGEESAGAPQWLAVERWRRREPVPGGVTLVCAHANDLNKEFWIPVVQRLLAARAPGTVGAFGTGAPLPATATAAAAAEAEVNDVWLVDDTHHGASVDLNAGRLSARVTWDDGARNLLNLVRHVVPFADGAGWQLGWHAAPSDTPGDTPGDTRRVVGVGHSIGGNGVVLAACADPGAFAAVLLVEPMCTPQRWAGRQAIALATLKRRDVWPTLAAAAGMRASPLCAAWSERAFALWLRTALVPHPSGAGGVTLATPRWCEAACFASPSAPSRAWDSLLALGMPVGFVMAAHTEYMGGDACSAEMCRRPPRARHEVAPAGHLVVQEQPDELGDALARFLATLAAGTWDRADARL